MVADSLVIQPLFDSQQVLLDGQLIALYTSLARIRLVEERIAARYAEQEMRCPVHLCIGQEAIAVGVCANLRDDDSVFSAHRAHGHYLAKGGDLTAMLAEFYGKVTGCAEGRGGSMHLIDRKAGFLGSTPIVGSTIPIAVGAAFADHLNKTDTITTVFFGDAAVETGAFFEAANFAVLHKLPVLFVCENNLYSVYTPMEKRQPEGRKIAEMADGIGLTVTTGDGNDLLAVTQIARAATAHIRSRRGPAFLEFSTYRWLEHCGPNADDHLGYRPTGQVNDWLDRCPVREFESYLEANEILDDKGQESVRASIETEIDTAFEAATSAPFPKLDQGTDRLYATGGAE